MTRNNIGYHTRLAGDNTVKCVGGSFGGAIDMETVNRLTRSFTVRVKPSGTPVFVDQEGREVRLYLSVDPDTTEIGKAALKAWREERAKTEAHAQQLAEAQQAEIEDLLGNLGHDEAVRRLRGREVA